MTVASVVAYLTAVAVAMSAPLVVLWVVFAPVVPPTRTAEDEFLLALLAVFYLLKAVLIERRDRLGWAMAASQVGLGMLFGWAWLAPIYPVLGDPWLGTNLRRVAVVTVLWAILELLLARFWPRRAYENPSSYRPGSRTEWRVNGEVARLPGARDKEDHGPRPTDHPGRPEDAVHDHQSG